MDGQCKAPCDGFAERGVKQSVSYKAREAGDRHRNEVVPFLIKQFTDKERTHFHVDPYDAELKGEFAVYCLQRFLKVNWIELKEDYERQFYIIEYPDNHQKLLRRILRNKNSLKEMQGLWMKKLETSLASNDQK